MDLGLCPVVQGLMGTFLVVGPEVLRLPQFQLRRRPVPLVLWTRAPELAATSIHQQLSSAELASHVGFAQKVRITICHYDLQADFNVSLSEGSKLVR